MDRRDFLKKAGSIAALPWSRLRSSVVGRQKSIVVVGAGIGGLTCGYELLKRGHHVTLLEAADQAGGHVRTLREGLSDGLYADLGAEHFTVPGYTYYRKLVEELDVGKLPYPRRIGMRELRGGRWISIPEDRSVPELLLRGFSRREARFLAEDPERDVRDLYFRPYIERFENEYDPFGSGLAELDFVTVTELLRRDGASEAALQSGGGAGSALQAIWHDAILHLRGVPKFPRDLYRIQGGNQNLPLAMADVLGDRIRFGSRVERIEHGETGVSVTYTQGSKRETVDGDAAVVSIALPLVARIEADPPWAASRRHIFESTSYYTATRLVFQTRTRFWEKGRAPNLVFGRPELYEIWPTADEVDTPKGILLGNADGATPAEQALEVMTRYYPEAKGQIERSHAMMWPLDPYSPFCERTPFGIGELSKVWPEIMEPFGRIHFASAGTDNLFWGMEAATRSALRTAEAIDAL